MRHWCNSKHGGLPNRRGGGRGKWWSAGGRVRRRGGTGMAYLFIHPRSSAKRMRVSEARDAGAIAAPAACSMRSAIVEGAIAPSIPTGDIRSREVTGSCMSPCEGGGSRCKSSRERHFSIAAPAACVMRFAAYLGAIAQGIPPWQKLEMHSSRKGDHAGAAPAGGSKWRS